MPTEFRLPELGENIESGDLVKVLVSVGQKIDKDQSVIELETDKATIEVPSPVGGLVKEIHVKEGDKVKVGQLILTVEDGVSGAAKTEGAVAKPLPQAAPKPDAPAAEEKASTPTPAVEEPPPAVSLEPQSPQRRLRKPRLRKRSRPNLPRLR